MSEFWTILLIAVFGVLSLEIGFSTAILEMIAGVIGGNLFGEVSPSWMSFIANYGLLGLMFLAGLEIDRNELRKHFRRSSVLALPAYLIPFMVIFAIVFAITLDPGRSTITAIALSTTSLALLYPLLRERGLVNLEMGHVILSAAMLVDVFSMISLSIAFSAITYISLIFLVILALFMFYAPGLGDGFRKI